MSIEKRSRFFRIRSLKKCLVLSFILLICALFAIFFYYIFGIAARTKSWERKNFLELSELAAERLQGALADSQNVAVTLGYSAACQKFLLSENPNVVIEAKRTASDTISYARLYGNHFKDIVLLGVNERLISNTTSYREITELVLTMTGMGSMEERRFTDGFYAPVIVDRDSQYLVYVFPVYGNIDGYRYRYNPITGLVIYDLDELLSLAGLDSYEDSVSVLLHQGEALGSSRALSEEEAGAIGRLSGGENEAVIGSRQYLWCRQEMAGTGLELYFLLPNQAGHQPFFRMGNMPLLLIILFLMLILILMVWILRGLHHDIYRLVSDIRRAENTEKRVHTPYIQELGPISEVLNKTFESLRAAHQREQSLMADKHEAVLAQTQAEMLAYRSQITPHFLFNTLESMRSLAHHYKAEPIEGLIGGMSQMFRYSLEAPQLVTLRAEIGHLESYLSVMEVRFPGRYRVQKALEEETLSCYLPSMSLQPLVENMIKHGFQGRMNGVILIQSFLEGNCVVVRVADNGVGIKEERLEEIRRGLYERTKGEARKPSGTREQLGEGSAEPISAGGIPSGLEGLVGKRSEDVNIGLANISRRLCLNFGEEARMEIRSKEDYYTVIELHIPVQGGRGEDTPKKEYESLPL